MKYSLMFGKTRFGEQKGSDMISHQLLVRAGFIRESTAGRYFFLPLGLRTHDKIKAIVKDEMDKAGGQEMISPVLHPLELWQETNRTNTAGFELMRVKDRRGAGFALGGTAEEMFVDVVRKFNLSYKDLPFNIYQFSTKFRDEMRARGGLLRVREFVMKDAYSFARNEEEFKVQYQTMWDAYTRMFTRMGLTTRAVAADGGYIGGEYCHEFQVEHPEGEGRFFVTEDGSYCVHEDIATCVFEPKNANEPLKPYQVVDAVRGTTMEDGVKLHGLPEWQQLKDVMFIDEKGRLILVIIRGDLDVNEVKVLKLSGSARLEHATEEQIRALGSEPGFISPVGMKGKALVIADVTVRMGKNFYGGGNAKYKDALNMNIDRDFTADIEGDVALVREGFVTKEGSVLHEKRGIEVGNIFQLGYHYTNLMKNAVFVDNDGTTKKYYMGCYGFGLGRTLATIVEKHHDDRGMMWPMSVTPYQIHLVSLKGAEARAEVVYEALQASGLEVLCDDRTESPGVKFADADLIGIPVRLVVSPRTGDNVEYKLRSQKEFEVISVEEAIERVKKLL